jgi:predicted ATPase
MAQEPPKMTLEELFTPVESNAASPVVPDLSAPVNPLIGRERELQEIRSLLEDPSCRLLSLVGPGGVGKSRLALQVALESKGRFADGVCFVYLVSVQSAELLAAAIANAFKISFYGQEDMRKQVLNFMREKEMLLFLDNFEHLLEESDWLVKIREECPKVKIVVTSRESLGLKGERLFMVKGLRYPSDESEKEIDGYGAVQLFLLEAKNAHDGFIMEENQKPYLISLCQFLDGMPLGLGLAASCVKTHSLEDILTEVKHNRDFLASTYGDIPERHRSIRAVFESSWNALTPGKKTVLSQLSVFQSGFTGEASQAVTGAPAPQLMLLADKSLLEKSSTGRFGLHPLLKQYLEEKLEEAPEIREKTRDNLSDYFAGFVGERALLLHGPRQKEALEDIKTESENIRAAWTRLLEKGPAEKVESFLDPIFLYFEVRGLYGEGEKIFNAAAKVVADRLARDESAPRALRALYGDLTARQGTFFYQQGDNGRANEILRSSLTLLQEVGSGKQIAFAVNHLCFVLSLISGNFQEAKDLLEKVISPCEKRGDKPMLALSLKNLGYVNWRMGNYTEARQQFHRSQNIFQELGDADSLAIVLTEIVNLAFDQSRYEEAEELCLQSLKVYKEIGHRSGEAWTLGKLANIHWARGNYEIAQKLYAQALRHFRDTGDREGVAWAQNSIGLNLRSMGDCESALKCFQEGIEIYQGVGHRWGAAWSMANRAFLECVLGHYAEATKDFMGSYETFKSIENPWGTAFALDGLGWVAFGQGRAEEALKYYSESFSIFRKNGNQRDESMVLCHLGEAALVCQEPVEARKYLTPALRTAMEIFAIPVILKIMFEACLLAAQEKKTEVALIGAFFILNHTATEWEVKEKARVLINGFKEVLGDTKFAELDQKSKGVQLKQAAEDLLAK